MPARIARLAITIVVALGATLGTVAAILMASLTAARIASGQPCVTIFGIGGCGPGVEFGLYWDPVTFVQGVLVILSIALLILAVWLRTLRR